jgi:hypothetical protein
VDWERVRTHLLRTSSCFPFTNTACRPFGVLPSVMTAKERFFCFRIDLIHPETVVGVEASVPLRARTCLIVGGRENCVADDASLWKIMVTCHIMNTLLPVINQSFLPNFCILMNTGSYAKVFTLENNFQAIMVLDNL